MKFKPGDLVVVVSEDALKDKLSVGELFTVLQAEGKEKYPHLEDDQYIRYSYERGEWTMSRYLVRASKLHKVLG